MMATRISPQRRALIAAVHTAAKEKGLDEDTRRDKIALVTGGKRSAADCTDVELRRVLDAINGASRPSGRKPADTPVAKKARALWLSLHALGLVEEPSESALRAWVRRQYQVDDLAFLPPADSFAVVEGLKRWATRAGVDWTTSTDPRRCVLTAQWRLLVAAGAAPAIDLGAHAYSRVGAAFLALATTNQLDRLIEDLGSRVRALPRGEGQ
ncbi:MAG TPA: regulatory protein GemA [Azospirillum sp.]|nr:regulatory protein GemA [Azospirillum sp.]